MRIVGRPGDMMVDSDAETGVGTRSGSELDPARMTAKERAALRKRQAAETAAQAVDTTSAFNQATAAIEEVKRGTADAEAAKKAIEESIAAGELALQLANEQAENARIGVQLAKNEEDRAAAEAALKAAQDAAARAAADAAAKAAAEKAALEAALAAAKDATTKANLQAALNAANAATAAAGNINTAGNVFLPNTPAAGGMGAADILAKQYAEQQAQREKDLQMQRESIMSILTDRFTRYNLQGLIPTIKRLAQEGATEATITLALQESEEYQRRFSANQDRIKKGLAALTPAEYLNVEDSYRQILRSYGLSQFDNDDYVKQFISNDVSPAELSNRVVTAVQRVQNADPAISRTLKDYYGISNNDLVAYVLDPNQQFQKIERQVAAAEIGTAARVQGLEAGVSVAEQLAAQGISQAEAQRGYATIADILPGAEKLSGIYRDTLEGYGQAEAEQEVFNTLASAQRKRRRLTEREIAEFSGASGVGRTALSDTMTRGQF